MIEQEVDLNIDYYNRIIVNEGLDALIDSFYPNSEDIMTDDLFSEYFNNFLDQLSYTLEHD